MDMIYVINHALPIPSDLGHILIADSLGLTLIRLT